MNVRSTLHQLHWLVQLSTSFGRRHVARHPLWHHVALRVTPEGWTTATAPSGVRLLFRPRDARIEVRDGSGTVGSVSWNGSTLAQVQHALERLLATRGLEGSLAVKDPGGMPDHPARAGAPFETDAGAAASIEAKYAQAGRLLDEWGTGRKGAGPTLVFPHHFDASVLCTVVAGTRDDAEDARTVSAGFSPGDGGSEDPYWYVTPWPAPPKQRLPSLTVGVWHTEGWTGAKLAAPEPRSDGEVRSFLKEADLAARVALGV